VVGAAMEISSVHVRRPWTRQAFWEAQGGGFGNREGKMRGKGTVKLRSDAAGVSHAGRGY